MSRYFSSTARSFIRWLGFPKESLTDGFKEAVEFYSENGARKKVGEIESIEILHRNDGSSPIHQSHYNRNDREYIISARITPADGTRPKTHHIYQNGTGTFRVGDQREYSTHRE
ncbi:uncharacterized protein BKA55DRAFT_582923 [Fusarium redolens]|uniref:Uncharacterized protein n=1 Tax=Fusarium redolens TaxID=48865 RepID=A0A9P9JSH4_FUSRE|nr:uncharacterized protein BKA55DRAFT_582923 [Fusarium redolens]KAH7230475.1 hypothetical protein BKA55DRAFT_582923 [Fusarium redolens]